MALDRTVIPFRRKADRRTEAEDLRMSLLAAGQEMQAIGRHLEMALQAADPFVVVGHVAARLRALATSYIDEAHGRDPEGIA